MNRPFTLLEKHILEQSSAVFALDTWPTYDSLTSSSNVFKIQAREGVGAAIAGFTSAQKSGTVGVLATPDALALIASTLAQLSSAPHAGAKVVVSIAANSTNATELFEALQLLSHSAHGWNGQILFSGGLGGRQLLETVSASYAASSRVTIHVFDDFEASQEYSLHAPHIAEKASIEPFLYIGAESPQTLVVLPSSTHAAIAIAAYKAMETPASEKVGILTVNSLSGNDFTGSIASAIPASVTQVYAPTAGSDLESPATWFYDLALLSITSSGSSASVIPLPLLPKWTIQEWAATLVRVASPSSSKAFMTPKIKSLLPASSKLACFWSGDDGASATVAPALAAAFAKIAHANEGGVRPRLLETFDNTAGGKGAQGLGVKSADLLLSPVTGTPAEADYEAPLSALTLTAEPSFVLVSNPKHVLASYNPVERVGATTPVIFSSNWGAEEYKEKLPRHDKGKLIKNNAVYTINADAVAKDAGIVEEEGPGLVEQVVFWQFYLANAGADAPIASLIETSVPQDKLAALIRGSQAGLHKVDLSENDMEVDEEAKATPLHQLAPGEADATVLAHPNFISALNASHGPNAFKTVPEVMPELSNTWHLAAKQLLYPEAYAIPAAESDDRKRPDLAEENYVITVTENRRLTPLDYDRNVFHMEFSTKGTGLKYAVGEALGIHGLNDETEVMDFIKWYGLDPDAVVSYPSRSDPSGKLEIRTIFQLFQQTLDIFGKPPKSFYEVLGKHATTREEARHLRFISSAQGSSTFKKWADLDTVTYADVLKAFPSAKANFGIEDIMREVASIKPRHYSIASSQNAVGDSVHLLVVTVDWDTPAGVKRFGQCTRYLAGLPVGAKVMASIKPSVMKLPPRDTQPIIMAGLGTGAAPFRAFMQERAWQRAQGIEVGPLLYYFGARYRSAEYLYGEEIEAYVRDGVIGHTGLAFSRDTKAKVYIQHKMNQDGKLLADSLDDGVFYLCGPTWPVPDVYKALTDAFVAHRGKSEKEAEAYIEELKEDERYVLEVY